jgi:PmbA protein
MSQQVDPGRIPALKAVVAGALDEARRLGASQAEVDASLQQGLSVSVRLGEVETVEYQRDRGLGVTVYFGQRKGSASTADLSADAVRATVAKACAFARHTALDECAGLADPALLARDPLALELDFPWDIGPEAAVSLARECEAAGRAVDPRIDNSEGARRRVIRAIFRRLRTSAASPASAPWPGSVLGGSPRHGRRCCSRRKWRAVS